MLKNMPERRHKRLLPRIKENVPLTLSEFGTLRRVQLLKSLDQFFRKWKIKQ